MTLESATFRRKDAEEVDFFEYWDSLGFFEYSRTVLPPQFFVLFEIARVIFSDERLNDAFSALEEISRDDREFKPDRKESIQVNRLEKISPLSDRMEIEPYRTIIDLKKALPRELAQDQDLFDVKLLTKTLLVQRHYETEADSFKPISTSRDKKGTEANRYEQKFYLLLDLSKSMEARMRTFYSKCIIAEFLRKKYNSRAKIFYRPFDSRPGDLIKVETQQDFPRLIEEILFTTTGGTGTNIHHAVLQAISDINFDKEMAKSEILVVTDGISRIEKHELKVKLGDIKLNILKIGDDVAVPELTEMETHLKRGKVAVYSDTMDIRTIKKKMDDNESDSPDAGISIAEKVAFRKILDSSD
ncbi:MAG: VWA domain-containing protein [Chrysiogenales bacterium]|nr:MAG: VWA domain-containing protein [Chrysiogenales bacterium]